MSHSPLVFDRFDVLGIPVSVTTLASATAAIAGWAGDRVGRFVIVRDVHGVMRTQDDPAMAGIHRRAAMITADGMPLVWLGRRAGHPVERTCGADLMASVMACSAETGLSHYFYGGKPGIGETLAARFRARHPGLRVVGVETPPFRPLSPAECDDLAARMARSGADVVWIGISTPRQEMLMDLLATRLGATLIGVGAAFDFHAGAVRRAPVWMQRSGLEWAHRLAQEPRRLWYRYLVLAPRFVFGVARAGLFARWRR